MHSMLRRMRGVRPKRGAFIVFEGGDRSGKSTQCQKLVEKLEEEGVPSRRIQFPDRSTAIGQIINNYLTKKVEFCDEAIHLLFTVNRWEKEQEMKELLHNGITLVADRYCFSGVAYSSAKPGMSIDWCRQPETGLPKPDLVFFLKSLSGTANQRDGFGEERYETSDFQERVNENYQKLKDDSWKMIDGDRSIDKVHEEIFKIATKVIKEVEEKELKTLW